SLNKTYGNRKKLAFQLLDLLGCSYTEKQAGLFVWAKIPEQFADGYALSDKILYQARVFITPGGIFGNAGEKYIRISLCANEETFIQALERIEHALKNYKYNIFRI